MEALSPPINVVRRTARFTHLPTEILSSICEFLCLHCRTGCVANQDRGVVRAGQHDQRTLAHLARTCKKLREVAQPVLFHWYHSGCIPTKRSLSKWEWDGMTSGSQAEDDQLMPFLRSVGELPALAAAVQSFVLFTIDLRRSYTKDHGGLARYIAGNIGAQEDGPGLCDNWLEYSAPFILPRLKECLVVGMPGPSAFYCLKNCPVRLPHLTYLALSPWVEMDSYHMAETSHLLACIPNLEVLIAPDCGSGTDRRHASLRRGCSWDLRLEKLRVLSISNLAPDFLETYLRGCPALEDFEFYCDLERQDPPLSLEHLGHVRETLRRFCYSATPPWLLNGTWRVGWEYPDEVDQDDMERDKDMANDLSWWSSYHTMAQDETPDDHINPFDASVYPRLEILEIEQILLYGAAFNRSTRAQKFADMAQHGTDALMARLPPSLRVLHIGMVVAWPELRRDLTGLALVARTRFPHLHTVHIDTFVDQLHDPLPGDDVQEIAGLLRAAGIVFRVGRTPEGSSARGMLGPRPGRPEIWRVAPVLYGLDGKPTGMAEELIAEVS
jgi:hypothetical protein